MTEKDDVTVEEKKTTGVKKDLTITGKELEYQTFFLDDYQVGFLLSLKYEKSDYVKSELMYITSVTGKIIKVSNPKAVVKAAGLPVLEAYNFTDNNPMARRSVKVESV